MKGDIGSRGVWINEMTTDVPKYLNVQQTLSVHVISFISSATFVNFPVRSLQVSVFLVPKVLKVFREIKAPLVLRVSQVHHSMDLQDPKALQDLEVGDRGL